MGKGKMSAEAKARKNKKEKEKLIQVTGLLLLFRPRDAHLA